MTDDSSDLDALLALSRDADTRAPPELASVPEPLAAATTRGGVRERLRSLPTPARVALVVAVVLLVSGLPRAFASPRPDLDPTAWVRVYTTLLGAAFLAMFAAGAALRGTYTRPWPAWLTTAMSVLVLVPAALSLVPGWWGSATPMPSAASHIPCLTYGLVGAIVAAGATLYLDRGDAPAPWRVVAAAGAGGLVAYTSLGVHCASGNVVHLLVSHSVQGLLVGLLVVGWSALRARRAAA